MSRVPFAHRAKGVAKEKFVACVVVVSGGWVGGEQKQRKSEGKNPPTHH